MKAGTAILAAVAGVGAIVLLRRPAAAPAGDGGGICSQVSDPILRKACELGKGVLDNALENRRERQEARAHNAALNGPCEIHDPEAPHGFSVSAGWGKCARHANGCEPFTNRRGVLRCKEGTKAAEPMKGDVLDWSTWFVNRSRRAEYQSDDVYARVRKLAGIKGVHIKPPLPPQAEFDAPFNPANPGDDRQNEKVSATRGGEEPTNPFTAWSSLTLGSGSHTGREA